MILATSSGLILEIPSPKSVPPHIPAAPRLSLLIVIPSTTYSGWLFPVNELEPRITTLEEPFAPMAPPVILTPATLPCKALIAFVEGLALSSSPSTLVTE